ILLDHPISYALTATANVPAMYLQQLWRTWVAPANIQTIKAFMNRVGYQGIVDKLFHAVINRTNVDYDAILWWDFMNNVFQKKEAIQIDEDYHSIKDDIPLVDVPMNQPQLVVSTQGTNMSTPRALRIQRLLDAVEVAAAQAQA
ncbi:hypothetical protein Tco_1149859, partial [Tanacetum coccineum]